MEVHHHPDIHHKPKKWKEYLLEFFMIFLAVTMGFLAESIRERQTESRLEHELAKALYAEMLSDSAVVSGKMLARQDREQEMDWLSAYFRDSSLTVLPKRLYPAFTKGMYLMNTYAFEPQDGILNQLRNTGSLRYFREVRLQKLLGKLAVTISELRLRNEQEYQYWANPVKPFLLQHFDFSWLDRVRRIDSNPKVLDVIRHYIDSNENVEGTILNPDSFNRKEASNMLYFFKQMLYSTKTLQMGNYITTNHEILQLLRVTYDGLGE
jgi:hypothetical protein